MTTHPIILEAAHSRYSTKAFDPSKKISGADFASLKKIMQLAPSSINSQPWHFVIADDEAGKARLAKGAQGAFAYNEPKIRDASHVVLYCAKVAIDESHLGALIEQEDQDGRYRDAAGREMVKNMRAGYIGMHEAMGDVAHWAEKQAYLNLGSLLLAAGAMGIDAVPMEGIDAKALDAEFGLSAKGLRAFAAVALGFRSESDFNAKLPKSRLSEELIFTKA